MKARVFLMLAAALAFGACGGGSNNAGGEEHSSGGEAEHHEHHEEHDLSAFEGPVTGDAEAGATVFATFCAGCHPGNAPDLHNEHESPAEVRHVVRNGDGSMPAFNEGVISDADLENLVAFVGVEFGMY